MEIPEKLLSVLEKEGFVAIVSLGKDSPHLVNTWNTYISFSKENDFLIPVGGMKQTERNVEMNKNILVSLGSREVMGFHSMGTGFLIKAEADFLYSGEIFDEKKQKFPWLRAVLVLRPIEITQTL